jgi:hypothetical protein
MSTGQWDWLCEFCAKQGLRVIPCGSNEPWVGYAAIARLAQKDESTIEKLVSKHKLKKHPVFAGFTKLSFFEAVGSDGEET